MSRSNPRQVAEHEMCVQAAVRPPWGSKTEPSKPVRKPLPPVRKHQRQRRLFSEAP
jgi:hypothetical protein